jgi:APA family basic amino acid/polyamine antiporter
VTAPGALSRRLGLGDAVAIGLGSMTGAGVFAALAPAAAVAGWWMPAGLAVAALVAYANATASAQLAAQYPTSGGAYVYGRERLGPWPGFLAGWSFVVGKTASCAAMAMTFAAYTAPPGGEKAVAVAAVLVLAAVNCLGVTRTATLTKVLVAGVLAVLVLVIVAAVFAATGGGGGADGSGGAAGSGIPDAGWYGVLQSAGLLFFAFAGYARIATMGEEVRAPERTIPRAILLSLGIVLVVYAVTAVAALTVLGPTELAASSAPLADVAAAGGWSWTGPVVRAGAAAAALGALLALMAGVGRTSLAMAGNGDLPRWLSAVHPRFSVPHRAEIVLAVGVCALILVADLRTAIGFSSFGVLLYYLVANLSAYRQDAGHRRYPRVLQAVGAVGCVVLVATLPWPSIVGGVVVALMGVAYRGIRVAASRRV